MSKVLYFNILLVFIIASCGDIPLYEKVYSFENREWSQDVKPSFEIEITDISKEYNFRLSLRTTTDYKYSNLWIFMKTDSPDGNSAREPFEIKITDEKGVWIGNKTGSIVEISLNFKKRKLPLKGTYKFTIEQGITASSIDEVLDIGFAVEEGK